MTKHKTAIEWTHVPGYIGATWNPLLGCKVVAPGCANCYAMRLAGTRLKHLPRYAGLTRPTKAGPVWNGRVADESEAEWLKPMSWRAPHAIFVCDMSDLFYEGHTDEQIGRVFAFMEDCPRHIFFVLTKRVARMRKLIERRYPPAGPAENIWLGVSVEDQVPELLETSAAVRFVSAEPLLGPADLKGWLGNECEHCGTDQSARVWKGLDWVIAGGESGPGARPMHPEWARAIRDRCRAANVPFFFKQWGEWAPAMATARARACMLWPDGERCDDQVAVSQRADPPTILWRVGKKRAGATLDGRFHREFPAAEKRDNGE